MRTRSVVLLVVLAMVLAGTLAVVGYSLFNKGWGCAGNAHCRGSQIGNASEDAIRPTWVEARVEGDSVSVPLEEIDSAGMIHFRLTGQATDMAFMAYRLGGQIQVRAAICPPCRSESFSLEGDVLVCDTCGTKFDAGTGEGISGACVNYPKANVPSNVSDGTLVLSAADLSIAYENTRNPSWA